MIKIELLQNEGTKAYQSRSIDFLGDGENPILPFE